MGSVELIIISTSSLPSQKLRILDVYMYAWICACVGVRVHMRTEMKVGRYGWMHLLSCGGCYGQTRQLQKISVHAMQLAGRTAYSVPDAQGSTVA